VAALEAKVPAELAKLEAEAKKLQAEANREGLGSEGRREVKPVASNAMRAQITTLMGDPSPDGEGFIIPARLKKQVNGISEVAEAYYAKGYPVNTAVAKAIRDISEKNLSILEGKHVPLVESAKKDMLSDIQNAPPPKDIYTKNATGISAALKNLLGSGIGQLVEAFSFKDEAHARITLNFLGRAIVMLEALNKRYPQGEQYLIRGLIPAPGLLNSPAQLNVALEIFAKRLTDRLSRLEKSIRQDIEPSANTKEYLDLIPVISDLRNWPSARGVIDKAFSADSPQTGSIEKGAPPEDITVESAGGMSKEELAGLYKHYKDNPGDLDSLPEDVSEALMKRSKALKGK
jgi:hypothetical protein